MFTLQTDVVSFPALGNNISVRRLEPIVHYDNCPKCLLFPSATCYELWYEPTSDDFELSLVVPVCLLVAVLIKNHIAISTKELNPCLPKVSSKNNICDQPGLLFLRALCETPGESRSLRNRNSTQETS